MCPGCLLDENHTPPEVTQTILAYLKEKRDEDKRDRLRKELENATL